MALEHTSTAGVTGYVAGFLISIPVGPINLTIINEGARRGFFWALMIGCGSVLMESIYCAIALAGFSAFLGLEMVKSTMELLSFSSRGNIFARNQSRNTHMARMSSNRNCIRARHS